MRVPPLAFWANERINHQGQGFQVEQGFSDQLAQACHGLAQASPAKKAKKVTNCSLPERGIIHSALKGGRVHAGHASD